MNNTDNLHTDFLFSTPSFLSGAAIVFNVSGSFFNYNSSESENEADCKAIANDFRIVGADLRKSIDKIIPSSK